MKTTITKAVAVAAIVMSLAGVSVVTPLLGN